MNRAFYVFFLFVCLAVRCRPGWATETRIVPALRTVALSNQPAPGLSTHSFNSFSKPRINNLGDTAFVANLNCCDIPGGVWASGQGSLHLIALVGSPAAPGGTERFSGLDVAQIDDSGTVTLRAEMTGVPPEFDGIWSGTSSENLRRIAVSGDSVNGSNPPLTHFGIPLPSVAQNGFMASEGQESGRSVYSFLWASDGQQASRKVLQEGQPIPGAEPGVVYGSYAGHVFDEPVVNRAGQIGLRASHFNRITNEPNYDNHLILVNPNGGIESILSSGVHAPGFAPEVRFGAISVPDMNNKGDLAFGAVIGPFGVGSREGIWLAKHGAEPEKIALINDTAPGFPGSYFESLFFNWHNRMPIALSDRGDVAFLATLRGGAYDHNFAESIWTRSADGGLHPVIVEGQVAPGTPGYAFHSMTSTIGDMVYEMAMNRHSQLAVLATVQLNGDDRPGLFATDREGQLHTIVVFGDFIEIAPGVRKQVSSINFHSPLDSGQGSGINDWGEVAFSVQFFDGSSGLFVSRLVAIPEPQNWQACWMLIAGYFTFARPTRRGFKTRGMQTKRARSAARLVLESVLNRFSIWRRFCQTAPIVERVACAAKRRSP